jgi:hypothetical protein
MPARRTVLALGALTALAAGIAAVAWLWPRQGAPHADSGASPRAAPPSPPPPPALAPAAPRAGADPAARSGPGVPAATVVRHEPLAASRVRLVDSVTGAPIAGARLRTVEDRSGARAVTDADGRAEFDPTAGAESIFAEAVGYLPRRVTGRNDPVDLGDLAMHAFPDLPSLVVEVEPPLQPGPSVQVSRLGPSFARVGAARRPPIPAEQVEEAAEFLEHGGEKGRWRYRGRVHLPYVLPGDYAVLARHPQAGIARQRFHVESGPTTLRLTLAPGATVRWRGAVPAGTFVRLDAEDPELSLLLAQTDTLPNVPEGAYQVHVMLPSGAHPEPAGIVFVPARGTADLVVEMPKTLRAARGRLLLRDPGSEPVPAADRTVHVLGARASVRTDAAGHFRFTDLTPGPYLLALDEERPARYYGNRFDLVAGEGDLDLGDVVLDRLPDAR